jgi:chemotaxis protein histidine kinase CheA
LPEPLLELEHDGDQELVATLSREARTLEGEATVVDLADVGRVAYAMEELLEQLHSGALAPTAELADVLLRGGGRSARSSWRCGEDPEGQATQMVEDLAVAAAPPEHRWPSPPTCGRGGLASALRAAAGGARRR